MKIRFLAAVVVVLLPMVAAGQSQGPDATRELVGIFLRSSVASLVGFTEDKEFELRPAMRSWVKTGGNLTLWGAKIIDIRVTSHNGRIHVISIVSATNDGSADQFLEQAKRKYPDAKHTLRKSRLRGGVLSTLSHKLRQRKKPRLLISIQDYPDGTQARKRPHWRVSTYSIMDKALQKVAQGSLKRQKRGK